MAEESVFYSCQVKRFFSSPQHPDRLWDYTASSQMGAVVSLVIVKQLGSAVHQ
jgi:hypothetical protein